MIDVTFSLPGTPATPATVNAFGAVFSDVDPISNSAITPIDGPGNASIELFNAANASLGLFTVQAGNPGTAQTSLSFLGLVANAGENISRVHIIAGNQALGAVDSNGNPVDVVVMDDFIFGEPKAVPEPAAGALALSALVGATLLRQRRRG